MTLADRQAALVRALVAGAEIPPGFAAPALTATRSALMRKRGAEVAQVWPRLAESHNGRWLEAFGAWAGQRAPLGSLRDGWDFALDHPPQTAQARLELALREATFAYDGTTAPRRRKLPVVRLVRAHRRLAAVIQAGGRCRVIGSVF